MNPNEHEQHTRQTAPAPEPTRPETAEATGATGAPEAIQAADVDRKTPPESAGADPRRKARGVDWVRSSDLLARGSGAASRLAIDFNAHLAHKARAPIVRGLKHVAAKARELPPLSAFGRGKSHDGAGRGPVGMS